MARPETVPRGTDELLPAVAELLDGRRLADLRALIAELEAPDVADLLGALDPGARVVVFRLLPHELACEVFAYLDADHEAALVDDLSDEETRRLVAGLAPDDRTQLFEELPGRVAQRLLNLLGHDDLAEARRLLGYPEESVGRLMTPDYVAVRREWTIRRALDHVREQGRASETINEIYVVDDGWRLLDAIDLAEFVLADLDETVESIMDWSFAAVYAGEDQERAVELIGRYDRYALPVADSDGVLLGIVTVDDLLDIAEEEATEDFYKSAAVEPLASRYRAAGVFTLWRRRVAWLLVLVVVALLSSGVIAAFEETLESAIALAFFIPLLIGSGGNTGAQSATLVVRALATGDVRPAQWLRTLSREVSVGLALGATLGVASGLLGVLRGGIWVGAVVGVTMALIVLTANLVGTVLPFVLTRVGADPAVASSPLIATIMDALGLLIYFSAATLILGAAGEL